MQNTISGYTTKRKRFVPTDIGGACTAWYDFTDISSMYKDDGSGGYTSIAVNDTIAKIDNKAKDTATAPLANFMVQTTSSKQPLLKKSGVIKHYGFFTSGSSTHLIATKTNGEGAVSANVLSNVVLDLDAFTLMVVFKPALPTVTADQYIWRAHDSARSHLSIYVDNGASDTIQVTNADGVSRDNRTIASGVTNTADLQYWTYLANAGSTDTTADLYKNNDVSTGIGNGAGNDGDMNFSANSADNYMVIGGSSSSAGYFNGDIYEIFIFDALLSESQLRLMNKYIKTKYYL